MRLRSGDTFSKASRGGKVAMTIALNPDLPDGLLENLIIEDTAPAAGAQVTEFPGYIKGMKAVNAAKVTTRKEATEILSNWEQENPWSASCFRSDCS